MPIDREVVVAAYRDLLNREPESEEVVRMHAGAAASRADLVRLIVDSEEFSRAVYLRRLRKDFTAPVASIEDEVAPSVMDRLMARVRDQWRRLGEEDPYWSVLSNEEYRRGRMDARVRREFLATGAEAAGLVARFEALSRSRASRGTCFELGCGVGRVTGHLAREFDRVVAADISPGNLELARLNLQELGVTNVELLLLRDLADYEALAPFDFLYSILVLQHNTPPVQRFMLDRLLRRLRPGGGCLFQTAASLPGYGFSAERYLASPEDAAFELHALPMATVLRLLQLHGCEVLQVAPDPLTGLPGSFTYFALKR